MIRSVVRPFPCSRVVGAGPPEPVAHRPLAQQEKGAFMSNSRSAAVWIAVLLVSSSGTPTAQRSSTTDVTSATKQRALLDEYCVPCHNDRAKTANLSLEK